MPSRVECLMVAAMFLLGALCFSLWPQLDLAISGLFYRPGEGFFWSQEGLIQGIYWGVHYLSRWILALVLGAWLFSLTRRQGWWALRRRWLGFCLLALTLGPGLITDQLLKNHWGRARPQQVQAFGGSQTFTPALQPSRECRRNCSFVSGHATAGFAQMTWAWLALARVRRRWLAIAITAGVLIGAVRIVQGGHFASDVFFAFFAVWLGNLLAWALLKAFNKLPAQAASGELTGSA